MSRVSSLKSEGKPFEISKQEVWEAWEKVRSKKGGPGIDGQTLQDFEANLKGNLYKIWNRLSSGSYFPPPVKAVEIPKIGGTRVLGVPTVADRIAQTVAARRLEARVEPIFHADSYGYRPGRSPLDAVAACRERCWKYGWAIDLDVQKFFDTVPWDLIVKAVMAHGDDPWVVLYVKRWLRAPLVLPDGTVQERERGTPQGSAISPVLANLFMHYAFDMWMSRIFPGIPFERFADDVIVHCTSQAQAAKVLAAIGERMAEVGLRLHPDKTKVVDCRTRGQGKGEQPVSFIFLNYEFRKRSARNKKTGKVFTAFLPAVSKPAMKRMSEEVRGWRIHNRTTLTLPELARWLNPIIGGWIQYFGEFYQTELNPLLRRINTYLVRWLRKKYKRLKSLKKAKQAWQRIIRQFPRGFIHWERVTSF
jgi:group II intron reverse transcriptase/maturase